MTKNKKSATESYEEKYDENNVIHYEQSEDVSPFEKLMKIKESFRFFKNQNNILYFWCEGSFYEATERQLKELLRYIFIKKYKQEFKESTLDIIVKSTLTEQEKYCNTRCDTAYRIYYNKNINEIYYDLGNEQIVRITTNSIAICNKNELLDVAFLKANNSLDQVIPKIRKISPEECKRTLFKLSSFINTKNQDELKVLIIYIITTFIQNISHPILMLCGGPGSSKTTSTKFIRRIIDPSSNEIMAFPNQKDLELVLGNHYFCAFDNLGDFSIKQDISNLLCCAVTGATILRRKLYTDNEEMSLRLKNIIILNGIAPNFDRNDLIERSVIINMNPISQIKRKKDWELENDFNSLLPDFLNAIFNILSYYLLEKDAYDICGLKRMADFEEAGIIIDLILTDPEDNEDNENSFASIYEKIIDKEQEEAIYIDSFVSFVHSYLEEHEIVEGTPTEVFNKIKSKSYSQCNVHNANVFVKRLKEKEALLKQANIFFEVYRGSSRHLKIYIKHTQKKEKKPEKSNEDFTVAFINTVTDEDLEF